MLRRAEPHACAKIAERDACLKAANAALSHPRCTAPYFYMKAALLLTLSHLLKHALNRIFTQKSGGHVRDARRFFPPSPKVGKPRRWDLSRLLRVRRHQSLNFLRGEQTPLALAERRIKR